MNTNTTSSNGHFSRVELVRLGAEVIAILTPLCKHNGEAVKRGPEGTKIKSCRIAIADPAGLL